MGTLNRAVGHARMVLATTLALLMNPATATYAHMKFGLDNHYRTIRSDRTSTAARDKRAARKRRNIAKRAAH